jgi:hypothetical protein
LAALFHALPFQVTLALIHLAKGQLGLVERLAQISRISAPYIFIRVTPVLLVAAEFFFWNPSLLPGLCLDFSAIRFLSDLCPLLQGLLVQLALCQF